MAGGGPRAPPPRRPALLTERSRIRELESELAVAFGGRVAEELMFNRISTGASNDIKQATELAQQMIRSWGMSEILGPLSFAKDEEQVFLGREIAQHRDYSEETAKTIDSEVNRLVMDAYDRAKSVLTDHLDVLHKLAEQLLEKETILGAELDELILQVRPGIQLPSKPTDKEDPQEAATASTPEAPEAEATTPPDATADQVDEGRGDDPQEPEAEENTEPKNESPGN